jgi:trans-aconitate methyltransferase
MARRNVTDRKEHWERAWSRQSAVDTSWYQAHPRISIAMIGRAPLGPDEAFIDIGGGASLLVDFLLDAGYQNLTVLDISSAALRQAQDRLGSRARQVKWLESDVTEFQPMERYAIWHDRAAFHFLTDLADRARYIRVLKQSLAPGGQAIMAAFAPEGPRKCSGLDVVRYDADRLAAELGPDFILKEKAEEVHLTPAKKEQHFGFYRFARK